MKNDVAFVECIPQYSKNGPFSPDEFFPEYPFDQSTLSSEPNPVYRGIRQALRLLGLDDEHYGTPVWNPLGEIIKPGDTVVLKPNWVYHQLPGDSNPEEVLITHPSIIRCVLDYVIKACSPGGKIIIGDAPLQSADFQEILKISQIESILSFLLPVINVDISVVDFRKIISTVTENGQISQLHQFEFDGTKAIEVNLGESSFFSEIESLSPTFRVPDYDPKEVVKNHQTGIHKYLITSSVLNADVVINLPKLKSHKQCGITCSLKNLVGINSDKAYLPHYRSGPPESNGDEYPKKSLLKKMRSIIRTKYVFSGNKVFWAILRKLGKNLLKVSAEINRKNSIAGVRDAELFSGCWYGNDSAWRMVLDLNRILMLADAKGEIKESIQRKYLSIIDAVISGEGHGPLEPKRKNTGAILAGFSPVTTDMVATKCMGFDQERIPLIKNSVKLLGKQFLSHDDDNPNIITETQRIDLQKFKVNWHFEPPKGWKGHIELEESSSL